MGTASGSDPATWMSAPISDGDEYSSPSFSPDEADDVYLISVLERSTGRIITIGEGRTPVWTAREWLPAADTDSAEPELAATGLLSADSARLLVVGLLGRGVIAAGIAVVGVRTARRRTRA